MNLDRFPFRLGTTSYIIPDDILPNVRYLAGKVRDVELVLFEVDDGRSNLPAPQVIAELAHLAAAYDLTYTVHLPLDIKLAADGSQRDASLEKARRVIELTRPLDPFAYVLHLDGKAVRRDAGGNALRQWRDRSVRALELLADWVGGAEKLAVENLEGYPPDFNQPVLDRVPVSRCVDIGHLWLDGVPALPYLERALPDTRVVHLHAVASRDHASLSHAPPEALDAVLDTLIDKFSGVLTVEVFSEADWDASRAALRAALSRRDARRGERRHGLTFILGGARSGKSAHAQSLAGLRGENVLYVATAAPGDADMLARIEAHRRSRPAGWRTLEAPLNTAAAIDQCLTAQPAQVVLLDCLTLLASNVLLQLPESAAEAQAAAAVLAEVDALLACRQRHAADWIIVSNEVGMGLVPPYPLGRLFRDALGRANQRLVSASDTTLLMVAGVPLVLKS